MANRTEYMREYKRKQRARAAVKGLCTICATRKARKGLLTCKQCSEASHPK